MAARDDWTGIRRTPYGYLVQVRVRPFPLQSRRFPKTATLREMQRWREERQRLLQRAKPQAPAAGTLDAGVQIYLSEWGVGVHPDTFSQRARYLNLWCKAFPHRLRHTITTAEIRKQLAYWERHGLPVSEEGQRRKVGASRLAPETVNKVRQALYQLYAYLDAGSDLPNPVEGVPTRRTPDPEPRAVDPQLVRSILAAMPRCKSKARLYVIRYCGLRPVEVTRLQRGDWSRRDPYRLYVRTAKGGPPTVLPLTRSGAAAMRYFDCLNAWGEFSTKKLWQPWHRAAVKVGAGDLGLRPYDLRHTYGTELFRAARDIKTTQAGLRQKSVRMTMRYVQAAVSPVLESGVRTLGQAERERLVAARRQARKRR